MRGKRKNTNEDIMKFGPSWLTVSRCTGYPTILYSFIRELIKYDLSLSLSLSLFSYRMLTPLSPLPQLFAYVELESEELWKEISNTPVCQKWYEFMQGIMPCNPDNTPVSQELKEVFHIP
eukprot:TRINITY_DN7993_c0_g1_i1.p2 TRINITY_DN7993_c0_g1~~TRINITY_DN7993_c0_g1_i1.p2  ORF type:complete len:120 (+),score=11.00 TRINITY_DN7993_c0_g1_i1:617-976(+)